MAEIANVFQGTDITKNFFTDCILQLENFEDVELVELEDRLRTVGLSLWKLRCAILAEAQRRVEKFAGRVDSIKEVAAIFGYRQSTAYRKIKIWKTFYQDSEVTDRIVPNNKEYFFEEHTSPESWFASALRAEDPLKALKEAEERYFDNPTYSSTQFKEEIIRQRISKSPGIETEGFNLALFRLSESLYDIERRLISLIQVEGKDPILDTISRDLKILAQELAVRSGFSDIELLKTELVSARRIKESGLINE